MPEKLLDRNHKVSSESWDGVHTRHYPMHYTWPIGWQYYKDNSNDGRVYFTFEETALKHLEGKIERGQ